uniref:2-hydroxyacyl-CoA lyase 2 n=2 Tax=Plectus sambesii TaxID=2011161 RepID=A0A914VTR4_9BILA
MLLLLIAFSVAVGALVAYLIDLDSMASLTKIFRDLSSRKQHPMSSIFQVEEESKNHGGLLVAQVLKAHGVEHIFTLCGGHISPILVACEAQGIRVVDTRHEVTTVFAADAVARLKQSIGVAAVTAGPGLTNTITAVKNAQMAESPILLLGGAAPTLLKNRGALQDIEQLALFRPLCKFTARIKRVKDIVPTLRKAIQAAQSGTPGPVFVEFPVDTLYPWDIVAREIGFAPNARSMRQKMVNGYLMWHISRQFGGAWNEQTVTPLPVDIPKAKVSQLEAAVDLLVKAKRPLLLIGSQAMLPPTKPDKLRETVENLGIPCYLGGMSRGLLGKKGRLQMRQDRKTALKEADLVILAGTICDFRLSYGRVLSHKSKVIAINRNHSQLHKNAGIFWTPTMLMQADVGSVLVQLRERLKARDWSGPAEDWVKSLRERDDAKEAANLKKGLEKPADGNLNPLNVLYKLDQVLPDDSILVADGGDFVGSAAYIVRPRGPLQWLDPGAFGTLGVGGGFALGAKCVHPDKPVWIIYGDGSCGYSLMEYDSYVRHKLPVVAVVGNDACWSQIAREQIPMFKSSVAVDLNLSARYEDAAAACGAVGPRVPMQDEERVADIFTEVSPATRTCKAALVNVLIGKTDFREGSISV